MSKICAKCGIEKADSEFRKDNKSKDKLGCWCKNCDREYRREYYKLNRDKIRNKRNSRYNNDPEYRQKQNEANKKSYAVNKDSRHKQEKEYRIELQKFVDSLKTNCVKCGESRPWLIQFHHIDPTNKSFQVQATHSKEKLQEEAGKCVCLCSNCHTEYHYFFGKRPSEPIKSLGQYLSEEFVYEPYDE